MSFSDELPAIGEYCYSVYAITDEGNGKKASACAMVGDLCEITFVMASTGSGWSGGSVTVQVDGSTWGTVTLASGSTGTVDVVVPSGNLNLIWVPGYYDCRNSFTVLTAAGDIIYQSPAAGNSPCGTPGVGMFGVIGSFYNDDYECDNGGFVYRVYRDGDVIAPFVPIEEYLDSGFDVFVGHEWCVTVVCESDLCGEPVCESPERCASLTSCGTCDPIENLVVTQPSEGAVHFEWTIPTPPGFLGIQIIRDGIIIAPLVAVPQLWYTDYVSVGMHHYCFIALYDKPQCNASAATCLDVNVFPQCDPVKEVTATVIAPFTVKVSWMSVDILGVESYTVYRDDEVDPLGTTTQTFYIDEEVAPGEYIYSVVVNYAPGKPCSESDPVDSEPVIVETCAMVTNLEVVTATTTAITIKWEAEDDVEMFAIYRNSAWIADTDELTYTDEGTFAEGVIYTYCVKPLYNDCQVTPECVEAYIEPCVPADVTNVAITGNQDAKTATITWDYTGTGATFDILRNNVWIANVSVKTYTDNIEYDVVYKYCIYPVAECAGGAYACNTITIDTPKGIIDPVTGLAVYPNPASSQVVIEGKDVLQVDIYNVVGQLVETIKSAEGEYISTIDVAKYASGAYVFKIYTSDKAIVNKPIVVRH
jgi:hypothetical protein